MILLFATLVGRKGELMPEPRRRRRFDPHKAVGVVVIYGLAAASAIRFLTWLLHDIFR